MDLQFIIIVIFSTLAAIHIIASVERKESEKLKAELVADLIKEAFGPVDCRCGLEDVSIKINWRQKDKKKIWVGTVNETECFEISALKNSDYEINFDMYLFTETLPIYLNRFSYLAAAQTTAQHVVCALSNAFKEIR